MVSSMEIAKAAAPEIDRLVFGVGRMLRPKQSARIEELARECGLETMEFLPHFRDFLANGTLTTESATLRGRYRPVEALLDRLDELERKDLIRQGDAGFVPSPALQPLLDAMEAAKADVAADLWGGHEDEMATVSELARQVISAATDEHVVAVAHRAPPEPDDPYLRLARRLMTLRYIRQHDHAEAWLAKDLSAPEIVVLTKLWRGDEAPEAPEVLARLADLGYVTTAPPKLTEAGREVREAIEDDTNDRAELSFAVLDEPSAAEFLGAMGRLPG